MISMTVSACEGKFDKVAMEKEVIGHLGMVVSIYRREFADVDPSLEYRFS